MSMSGPEMSAPEPNPRPAPVMSNDLALASPEAILAKASQHARSLSVESAFMTDETKEQILQKANSHAQGVASKAKDYTPN